jgi:LuxR family maltose regulon positive regulatory protein
MSTAVEVVGAPLIWTKLNAPVPRDLVSRAQVLELLCDGPPRKLTLIRAPAGWGKSTLLADWHSSQRETRPFAWLGVEREDDEPVRFWTYTIEALRTVAPEVGAASLAMLRAPGVRLIEDVLPVLVNELVEVPGSAVLVLDDYHAITSAEIHEGISLLLEYEPEGLELVVSSRSAPPLPLARLRGRGQLLEVDPDLLRFTEDEVEALLNRMHGLELERHDVVLLRERTEGWAAGLYLAALSLRGRSNVHAFVESFAGDDRHVVDYLSAEVLAGLADDVRAFLLRTSVLDRLCSSLCDAVTASEGSAAMLEKIERSNFFLVPLDTKREWYRYHHLFGDLLRAELEHGERELIPTLHRRAAGWLLDAGFVSEGILHTIAAGDIAEACELVAEHWALTLLGTAGDRVLEAWLSALPEESLRADVRLCVARAFVGLSLGRMDDVEEWLAIGESAPRPGPFRDGFVSVRGALACVRAAFLWETGDVGRALAAGSEAREAEAGSPWEAIGVAVIGLAHAALGEWGEARRWMAEYARIGRESGHHLNHTSGLSTVSACYAETGEWEAAEQTAEAALDIAVRHGISEHWCTAHAHLARGLVLERRGEIEDAQAALERSVELARRGAGPVSVAWPLLHLARVLAAGRDGAAAHDRIDDARLALASARDGGIVPLRLAETERSLGGRPRAVEAGEPLSDRELAVLRLLATRLSQREIGRELYLSLNTVKTHSRRIFRKLGVSTRAEAVERARELTLI